MVLRMRGGLSRKVGLEQFADLRGGGLGKKEGGFEWGWGELIPQCTL